MITLHSFIQNNQLVWVSRGLLCHLNLLTNLINYCFQKNVLWVMIAQSISHASKMMMRKIPISGNMDISAYANIVKLRENSDRLQNTYSQE